MGKRKMEKKLKLFILVFLSSTIFLFSACKPTPPEEAVISKKEEKRLAQSGKIPTDTEEVDPSKYTWRDTVVSGETIIDINVEITEIPLYSSVCKVIYRDFAIDDVHQAINIFAGDASLSNYSSFTKGEIENQILEYRQYIKKIEGGDYHEEDGVSAEDQIKIYEEEIKKLEKEYQNAPESDISTGEVDLNFVKDNYGEAVLLYFINNEDEKKTLIIRNFSAENSTLMRYMDAETNAKPFRPLSEEEKDQGVADSLPPIGEVNGILSDTFSKLGIEKCYLQDYEILMRQESAEEWRPVYALRYSRDYGNGEISLIDAYINSLDSSKDVLEYDLPHQPETIDIITDGTKIDSFVWAMPHSMIQKSDNIPLLPFDEIRPLLEKQLARVFVENVETSQIKITDVKLSNSYIKNLDDNSYSITPVWDMIGYEVENKKTTADTQREQVSFVTISAVDGTIINRTLNY